ncbi:FHA domain-containing protein [Microbacterium sp. YJN-G]|uniref:FHA domain-containing protein n=1 Tax=Microbacterium sp. YJN-G TaxID=2763257 RepID=UPI001878CAC5|nr:FHA domain-containing protein [Microbacterium sp. YJN-G]
MNEFTYRPGDWQVVVEQGGVAAVPADAAPERIAALTRVLRETAPALTEVIDAVSGGSIAALGAFAVALITPEGTRFAVRGDAVGVRAWSAQDEEFSGADITTWSERFVAGPGGFELSLGATAEAPAGPEYTVRSGTVLAAGIRLGERPAASQPASAAFARPAAASSPDADADSASAATPEADADAPATYSRPATAELPVVSGVPGAEGTDGQDAQATPEEDAAASTAEPEPTPELEHEPVAETGTAAIDEIEVQHTLIPSEYTYAPEPPAAPEPEAGFPEATIAGGSAAAAAPGAAAVAPVAGATGDHDGETISLAEARRLRSSTSSEATPTASADAATEVLPVVEAAKTASNGVVRLSTGQVIELDRSVIIGRRPRSTRASGTSMPHLVAVDSPQQDISRNHLEIRPEGDSVVVIDLHTTNGSLLMRPGTDPVRLHPGEHTLVLDGDIVDLGDGVTLGFEGLT